jgi:gluconolactonase
VFTDIPANTIFRYVPGGSAPVSLRMPSEMANGLAIAPDGALWAAEHGSRTVTRDAVAMASMFEGSRLNSPNDVVIATDGTAYFTDPPFGIGDQPDELTFMGVFRLSGTTLTAEHRGGLTERPNGIGLSPDGARLYVAYSNDGVVYRFGIQADGSLGPREPHATTSGGADGLALDGAGNVFVTSSSGVEVFAPDGSKWGDHRRAGAAGELRVRRHRPQDALHHRANVAVSRPPRGCGRANPLGPRAHRT